MIENRESKFFYGYIVVVASFVVNTIAYGTLYSFGVFFKPVLTEFGWTRAMTSVAFSLAFVLKGLFGIATGKLTDKFGPRIVVTVCGLFLGLGYLLVSQISAIWQLYLFYGVMIALGMSGAFVPLASTIARWFVKRRGMMTGIVVSGTGVGTMIMPPVANWLISTYGWRTSYIVVGIIVLVSIIVAAQFLRRDPSQIGQVPYGGNEIEEKGYSQAIGISLWGVVHDRQFWMFAVAWLSYGLAIGTIQVHVVLHAIGLGVSAANAAIILAVIGGLSTGGRLIMGGAGDRIGNKKALIIGFISLSIAFFWLLVAKELWILYLFAVIFGFGYGGLAALVSPIIAEQYGLSSHGIILGVMVFSSTIGVAIGPVMAGYIFDITGSYNPAFLICAIISVAGLILVSFLRPGRGKV